jgi:nucleoside-diphosphate-sugar epimerase
VENVVSIALADWLARPHSRVAVIGASGWIGMALVDRLLEACPSLSARLALFGSAHRTIAIDGKTLGVMPLGEAAALEAGDWLVLHAAIIGADRVEGGDWQETRRRNDDLLAQALALAEGVAARRLVFFSSGAVHRQGFGSPARQAYARMKAEHEQAVARWAQRRRLLVPRVFNLGGPYINHAGAYALGDFIQAATRDGRIAIGAANPVFRSYVHVLEMADLVLGLAVQDHPIEPFDIAGAETVELGALARLVGTAMGVADIAVDRPPPIGAEADWYVGDGRVYQAALFEAGGVPVPLARIVADTARYLAATHSSTSS